MKKYVLLVLLVLFALLVLAVFGCVRKTEEVSSTVLQNELSNKSDAELEQIALQAPSQEQSALAGNAKLGSSENVDYRRAYFATQLLYTRLLERVRGAGFEPQTMKPISGKFEPETFKPVNGKFEPETTKTIQ